MTSIHQPPPPPHPRLKSCYRGNLTRAYFLCYGNIIDLLCHSELLKIQRREYLFQIYKILEVPLMDSEIDERFQTQVLCS